VEAETCTVGGSRPDASARHSLEASEEMYRLLFEHVDDMVCTLDLEGRLTSVNRAGERLTGYGSDELVGTFAVELIAPELRARAVQQFQDRLSSDSDAPHDESVLVTREGRRVPIQVTSTLCRSDGRPATVLGLVQDLTERKRAEHDLDRSEARFQALLEAAPDGIVIADPAGRIILVNAQTEELFGYERGELIGQPVETLLPAAVRNAHRDHRAAYLAEAQVRQMGAGLELAGRRKDGSEFPVDISLSPLRTDDGVLAVAAVRDISDRRRAEEALRQSEERFRSAFAFAAIGMALVAPDGTFLQVNDSLCDLVGYSADELLTKTFQDITHPEDLEADLEFAGRLLAGEVRSYQMEKRYVRKAGDVVWALLSVSLLRSRDGRPLYFISQIQDITERKRGEEAIARSEARLAEAQKLARIGSWEWHIREDRIVWTDELYRIFGPTPGSGELTYGTYLACIHPEDRPGVESTVAQARAAGDSYVHEYRVVHPDGTTRWVHGRGEIELGEDGPVSMRGTAQDITERKEAEERLAAAERRYRAVVEQLPLVTYIRPVDMSQPNIYVSPQVEPMLGYPAEDWQTHPDLLAEIVHPDDRERVLAEAARVRGGGEPFRGEYRLFARDGHVVWVQDETYVVPGERGEPCVQGYLLDITERKLAEEERNRLRDELHHAQKLEAIGRLAGGVAHDFNNMLTAIKGYSELLLDGLDPSSPLRADAEQIRRTAEQASSLPKQLLAFSRKQTSPPKLVDLNDVLSAAGGLLERLVGETIDFAAIPEATSAGVLANPGQVEQVLLNLVVNARDAMPAGGALTIRTRNATVTETEADDGAAAGAYVVVSVTDTGQGMDAETTSRAFEPFFTTKGPGKGSGLGLATVYGIVSQNGGFVRVDSEPGRGTVLEVYLPCAASAADRPATPTEDPGAADGCTVLLAEDEETVRRLAATVLERNGYHVLAAASGAEALDLCRRAHRPIDVLVTDMVMPGMSGKELAQSVLATNPGARVVVMSGYSDEAPFVDSAGGDAAAFLQKPFSPRTLVGAVQQAIDRPVPAANHGDATAAVGGGVTCLIADDHPAVLDSISRFLEQNGIHVVARASRGDEALSRIETRQPSIALLDIGMEPLNGIEVARRAALVAPRCRTVLYTGHHDSSELEQALQAGVRGFVLKDAPLSELTRALTIVAGGGTYVDPELSGALATAGAASTLSPLTAREQQVLALLADGMTNEKAANTLGISPETVQSHVRNAMAKLDADTRTQAVAAAIRQSLIG
jgi:two-component system, cell cycle sensor histidine kinase and response regulator CckA